MSTTDAPAARPLKVYAFDPTKGRNLNNHMVVKVRYEPLKPGPCGGYVEVIDYDAENRCYYDAVNLDSAEILIRGGLDPSESDPRFHQQMVYAVVMETIRRFEFALGRKIRWRRRGAIKGSAPLKIFPHAIQEANAFYDPDLRSLVFGYFPADPDEPGANLPGQTVFTCLSHDIIVHETTHALIDGLRDSFIESTSVDTPALHEGFADIVALFQHFSFQDALLETIHRTGGRIHRAQLDPEVKPGPGGAMLQAELAEGNPLVDLARQFGEAMGMRAALRSAIGTKPNSRRLEDTFEPHDRGAILVAAVFDAFFSVYFRRTEDLMRIARAGADPARDDLHPDLARRLAAEASKTAEHFLNICVRALDYCVPIDIRFGEFLRAMITADSDLVPVDPWCYRGALIDAFRSRGVVPQGVGSYSEESLRWCGPETPVPPCKGLIIDVLGDTNDAAARRNARTLHRFAEANRHALGLSAKYPIQPHSFHPIHRVGPDGQLAFDFVVEYLQKREVPLDPADEDSEKFTFRGGSTVIFDQHGNVRYAILKRIENNSRLKEQREYLQGVGAEYAAAAYLAKPRLPSMGFRAMHRGY